MLSQVLKKNSSSYFKKAAASEQVTPQSRRFSNSPSLQDHENGVNILRPVSLKSQFSKRSIDKANAFKYQSKLYKQNLESTASFLSAITFAWTIEILKTGSKCIKQRRNLEPNDLYDCISEETPEFAHEYMKKNFLNQMTKQSNMFLQSKVEHIQKVTQTKKDKSYKQADMANEEKSLAKQKIQIDNMLYNIIKQMCLKEYIAATLLSLLGNLCQFVGPIVLNYIIKFLKNENEPAWHGYAYATIIFFGYLLRVFFLQHSLHLTNRVGIKVLNSLNTSIYNKILKLSASSKKYYDSGKTMNLVTVDSQSIFGYVMMAQNMITGPIIVLVAVAFIIYELGIIGLATPFFFFLGAYLQKVVNSRAFKLRRIILQWTDKRSKQLNEFFENIRIIKYYGWEEIISQRIQGIRKTETANLIQNQIIKTVVEVIMNSTPIAISLFIFGLYAGLYGDIESNTAYTIISLLNLLLNPLKMIVIVLLLQQNATTSAARINEFLSAEEQESTSERFDYENLELGEIKIQEASFSWDSLKSAVHNSMSKFNRRIGQKSNTIQPINANQPQIINNKNQKQNQVFTAEQVMQLEQKQFQLNAIEQFFSRDLMTLKNISLQIQSGEIVAIVGQVASGKSSLLLAILGEMVKTSGSLKINGQIAYIPQSPWLQNSSLRDNIIFGQPFDEERYFKVIEKCQLTVDLQNKEVFPLGDLTEIGERGVNLSGGQKQRIGIARAVYANADIYLIDDCLSALDAHVGKLIFYDIICGELEEKTVIFVTHAIHFIEDIEKIIVLKEGQIVNVGTHEFLQKNCQEYQKLTLVNEKEVNLSDESSSNSSGSYSDDSDSDSSYEISPEGSEKSLEKDEENKIKSSESAESDYQQERVKFERKDRKVRDQLEDNAEQVPDFNYVEQKGRIQNFQKSASILSKRNSRQVSRQASRQISRQNSRQGSILNKTIQSEKKKSKFSIRRSETRKSMFNLSYLVEDKYFEDSSIPASVYKRYVISGGKCATFNMFMSFLLSQAFKIISDWWIGQWSGNQYQQTNLFYMIIYFIFGFLQAIFIYLRGYTFSLFTTNSSNVFQSRLLNRLLHTPQWWYDVTPIGKIIARTTKDQDDLDSTLPWNMKFALTNIFQLVTVIVTIGIIFPHFIALGAICFYVYFIIIKFYLITSREIKKIEASTRGPVISHFQETTNGIFIIRAFKKQEDFMNKMLSKQRDYIVSFVNQNQCNRWVSVVTDLMGLFIVSVCAYFSVLSKTFNIVSNVSLIGLALSSSFQISQIISFTLKLLADTESNMNALVRMIQLIDTNPQESSWDDCKAPENWPKQGEIVFDNVSLKYRQELPQVINNLSFKIEKNQKIGVVGRTGCGKSTLTLGILRILEITFDQNNEIGRIILDGQDIRELGLHELRQKIMIIPQEPVLFSGTLKENVDPFNQYSEKDVVEILKKVSIWDQLDQILEKQQDKKASVIQKNKPNKMSQIASEIKDDHISKLNLTIESGGTNFSLGQRQLICIARAIIKKPKILLMDEATASIDEMTDSLIQNLIKQELKDATVITIAHRLKTIIQYDKILVLDKGTLKEFDTPLNLINKEQSFFRNLVMENGMIFLEEMKQLAIKKEQESKNAASEENNQVAINYPTVNEILNTQRTERALNYTFSSEDYKTNYNLFKQGQTSRFMNVQNSSAINIRSKRIQLPSLHETSIMKTNNNETAVPSNEVQSSQIIQDLNITQNKQQTKSNLDFQ
ncbi:ABC transporter C family protein (macronuclear) [Tetrahymena thermophila SB210]|uniref:ABC transporter C family protein n=1 Tax=Tetrahymena thermophila (strain SB210) TaxID=312017 RepID=I7LWM0_TETTS|nr:ABC transporter C family protein [Tetrahymena thermophila SB210]EAS02140.2 ABC transporter C family protein [Tetrahymena thermophila SB210]|eukprot:XP_001022385.2 ABC transporter C family protein [Tetrahymena thermophila SB210]